MSDGFGKLYLCATPIGNLEDMTFRAVRILREASLIAAEDTRHTRKLLSHYDIHTPLVSYHEHNKESRGPELITRLLNGEDIAVVSDAGMPGVSDPGVDLVRLAIAARVTVVPVPGANAALAGLVCSGLDSSLFNFIGFLPKTTKKRREFLNTIMYYPNTMIFYEAPHRLIATLTELEKVFGNRPAAVARELTKKFEEFLRGTLSSLKEHFTLNAPRGEITLIVAGCTMQADKMAAEKECSSDLTLEEAVMTLVAEGIHKKDAIREVALKLGLPKRQVYQALIESRDDGGKSNK